MGHNSLIDMIAFLWHSSCTMDPSFNASQSVRSDNILHVLWHGLLLYSFISLNINPPSESLCGLRVYRYSAHSRKILVSRATQLEWILLLDWSSSAHFGRHLFFFMLHFKLHYLNLVETSPWQGVVTVIAPNSAICLSLCWLIVKYRSQCGLCHDTDSNR